MVESKPELAGNRFWALLWAPVLYIHIFRGKISEGSLPSIVSKEWEILILKFSCGARADHAPPRSSLWVFIVYFSPSPFQFSLYQTLPHLPCSLHVGREILTVDESYRHCNVKSFANLSLPSGLEGVCIFVQSFALDSFVLFSCVSHIPFPKFAFSGGWQTFSPFFFGLYPCCRYWVHIL